MKDLVDIILKKAKKPIELSKIYEKIEELNNISLSDFEKQEIVDVIENGISNYEYYKTPNDRIVLFSKTSFRKGKFYGNRGGDGFVLVTSSYYDKINNQIVKNEKYHIDSDYCGNAIDGDIVIFDIGNSNSKPKIVKVIERNLNNIVGEVYYIGNSYFVKPIDKRKQYLTIALDKPSISGLRVSVHLKEQTNDNFYIGEIIRTFNHKDDPDEDILWEAFKCGIDYKFSDAALEQLEKIPDDVRDIDRIGREDLTNLEVFTIDGKDTKDIDDALSCVQLDNGNYEIGVHIADVSNYILENSPLDKDAYKRGTSYYLAGKVIPMFPHKISNGICSLNPLVDRLALSCIMEVSNSLEVVNYRITPTVIRSRLKMNYDDVNNILNNNIVSDSYKPYENTLRLLNRLALTSKKNRLLKGSIEFDRPELKLIIDSNGTVSDFSLRRQDLAENLIEEFMLLANETVDKHLSNLGYPCLHRVHDKPNAERLEEFLNLLNVVNRPYKKYSLPSLLENPRALQDLSRFISESGCIHDMLSNQMIKCMSRAKYSPINIGHSGLAKDNYCHFTSPIRRYPDLTIHRIVKECCLTDDNAASIKKWQLKLPEIGVQCSRMERISDDAERQTLMMKCSEYMQQHIGYIYYGIVIGVNERNILVQLDNMVEGRVRVNNLKGEYVFNPETFSLISLDGFDNYYIGDKLKLQVKAASKEEKTIDFSIVDKISEYCTDSSKESNQYVKIKAKENRTKGIF